MAPIVETVTRISAEEIQVTWNPIVDDKVAITSYVVKYWFIVAIQKRNTEDLAIQVETNQTNYLISQLDPRRSYGVSVAAKNGASLGRFSNAVITNCKL